MFDLGHTSTNHFTLDGLHGSGNVHDGHIQAHGTFHGNNGSPDLHLGGSIGYDQTHIHGSGNVGLTLHPTPNTGLTLGGEMNTSGGLNIGGGLEYNF